MNSIPLVDLENLTTTLYGPKQDKAITEYANNLAETYINNFNSFEELINYFIQTNNQHCQFWLLDLLVHIVETNYKNFPDETKEKFRKAILYLFDSLIVKITHLTFISNKFGLLFVIWIKHDFPEKWQNAFKEILSNIFSTSDENLKMKKISKNF